MRVFFDTTMEDHKTIFLMPCTAGIDGQTLRRPDDSSCADEPNRKLRCEALFIEQLGRRKAQIMANFKNLPDLDNIIAEMVQATSAVDWMYVGPETFTWPIRLFDPDAIDKLAYSHLGFVVKFDKVTTDAEKRRAIQELECMYICIVY